MGDWLFDRGPLFVSKKRESIFVCIKDPLEDGIDDVFFISDHAWKIIPDCLHSLVWILFWNDVDGGLYGIPDERNPVNFNGAVSAYVTVYTCICVTV